MENAKDDFNKCIKLLENNQESQGTSQGYGQDTEKFKCIKNYKDELKKHQPRISSFYDGYLLNYSPRDGTLIAPIKEEI